MEGVWIEELNLLHHYTTLKKETIRWTAAMLETMWADECQSHACFLVMWKIAGVLGQCSSDSGRDLFLQDTQGPYLGLIPGGIIQKKDLHLFKLLTLARKKAIRRNWLKSDSPKSGTVAGYCWGDLLDGKTDLLSQNESRDPGPTVA